MNISKYYIKNNRFKYGKLKNLDIRDYDGIKLYVPWRIRIMEKETRKLVDVFQGTSLYIDVYYREGIYLVTDGKKDYLISEEEINNLCFPCAVVENDQINFKKNYFDIVYERGSGLFRRKQIYHFNLKNFTPKIKDEFNEVMGIIFRIFMEEDEIAVSGLFHGAIDCMERLEELSKYAKEYEMLKALKETQDFLLKLFDTIKDIGGIRKQNILNAKNIIEKELKRQKESEKNKQREFIKNAKKEDFHLRINARKELLNFFNNPNPKIEDVNRL